MPKKGEPSTSKQRALLKLYERTIVFVFPAKGHEAALDQLLAILQEDIYSTHAQLVFSEDGMQAKIVLKANIVQMNNLDGFLRSVAGVKVIIEDPHAEMVRLITCYHHNLWDELTFPHEEMHLSAFVSGVAMRQSLLDYPDWEHEVDLWKQGEACYQALVESHLFADPTSHHEMLVTSFVAGYMAERGACELAMDQDNVRETARGKAQVLLTEEQGRPDIIIHTFVELIREKLLLFKCRNAMELLKIVRDQSKGSDR